MSAPEKRDDGERRLRLYVIGAVVAALVSAAAVVALLVLPRPDDPATDKDRDQAAGTAATPEPTEAPDAYPLAPPTSTPAKTWEWAPEGLETFHSLARGDIIVVGHSKPETGITRLSEDGEELWTFDGPRGAVYIDPERRLIFALESATEPGFTVVDADTGEELWSVTDRRLHYIFDDGKVLAVNTTLDDVGPSAAVFDADGKELWSDEGLFMGLEDQLYRNKMARLARLDPDTGEVIWDKKLHVSVNSLIGVARMEVARGLVVVKGRDSAVGVDAEFGKILWRKQNAKRFEFLEQFGPDYVALSPFIPEPGRSATALVVSRDGTAARHYYTSEEGRSTYFGYGLRIGDEYFIESQDWLYDPQLGTVGQPEGGLAAAGSGFYEFVGDTFMHNDAHGRANWTQTSEAGSDITGILGRDGSLLVLHRDRVIAYE